MLETAIGTDLDDALALALVLAGVVRGSCIAADRGTCFFFRGPEEETKK